jgi:hypothetical protein
VTLFRVDTRFADNPDVRTMPRPIRLEACGLWVLAGSWCAAKGHLDGHLPPEALKDLGASTKAVHALVAAGLWDRHNRPGSHWIGHGRTSRYSLWEMERSDYRRKISSSVRELVYRRDGYRCVTCGADGDLSLDHIFPWSLGCSDTPANLQTLCRSCNSRKGARTDA